jgi:hypothetical protein
LLEVHDQEHRIRAILGLEKVPLPKVKIEWLQKYYKYLAANLTLPFDAQYTEELDLNRKPAYSQVQVIAILDPGENTAREDSGLICLVRKAEQEMEVPLVDLEVEDEHANYQLLEDYWYWIWNWRFDPRI